MVVPRVSPTIVPRAYASQCGAPSPVNAGTKYTPSLLSTCAANASISEAFLIKPSPSRSHCTIAPAMNTLPSSAYSTGSPPSFHATVVRSWFFDSIRSTPVCINMKHPVPYVFFTIPGATHR